MVMKEEIRKIIREIIREETTESPVKSFESYLGQKLKNKSIDGWKFFQKSNGFIKFTQEVGGDKYEIWSNGQWNSKPNQKTNEPAMWWTNMCFRNNKQCVHTISTDLVKDDNAKSYKLWLDGFKKYLKLVKKVLPESVAYGPDNLGHTELNLYGKSLDKFVKDEIEEDAMNESLSAVTFQIAGKAYAQDAKKIALKLIKDYKIRGFNKRAKDELVKQLKYKWNKGQNILVLNVDEILKQQELGSF